jgi:AraC-like DNA-binding protein
VRSTAAVCALRDRLPAGAVTAFGPRMHVSLVRSGVVDLSGSGGALRVRAGELVVVPPGHHGYVRAVTDADSLVVMLDERFVVDVLRWAMPAGGLDPVWLPGGRAGMYRVWLAPDAVAGFEHRFAKTVGTIRSRGPLRAMSAALRLLSSIEPLLTGGDDPAIGRPIALRREVAEARRLLTDDPAHPWTVPELASRVGLSASALTRAFRAGLGVTPAAYLRQVRLARFTRLLTETRLGIAEAAWQVGWSSSSHARAMTIRHHGMGPRALRERCRRGPGESSE